MSFHNGTELDDVYAVHGVDKERGAMAVVRPHGCVGGLGALEGKEGADRIERYLRGYLRGIDEEIQSERERSCKWT